MYTNIDVVVKCKECGEELERIIGMNVGNTNSVKIEVIKCTRCPDISGESQKEIDDLEEEVS